MKLSDSLALYDLYAQLDPNLASNHTTTKAILRASANAMVDSLEAGLDALREIFLGSSVAPTKPALAPDDRNAFYANLAELQDNAAYKALAGSNQSAGRIVSLVGEDAQSLARDAQTDFGKFFALQNLLPVALGNVFNDSLFGGEGDDRLYGGIGNDQLAGGEGNDLLNGGPGDDQLAGDSGNDIAQGGTGDDVLSDTGGSNLMDGGAGADSLVGSAGNELFIGGAGADHINTGSGHDIVAFNRGDGADSVSASAGQDNTLSLGGGIKYSDIRLSKAGDDLNVELGGSGDRLILEHWYQGSNNKSFVTLQVIAEAMTEFDAASTDPLLNRKVASFNFDALVSSYDEARAADSTLVQWSAMNSLLDAHLSGSDGQAIGGDLAYRYAMTGSLSGMSAAAAFDTLNAPAFGSEQALSSNALANQGSVRLS